MFRVYVDGNRLNAVNDETGEFRSWLFDGTVRHTKIDHTKKKHLESLLVGRVVENEKGKKYVIEKLFMDWYAGHFISALVMSLDMVGSHTTLSVENIDCVFQPTLHSIDTFKKNNQVRQEIKTCF